MTAVTNLETWKLSNVALLLGGGGGGLYERLIKILILFSKSETFEKCSIYFSAVFWHKNLIRFDIKRNYFVACKKSFEAIG